MRLFDFFRKGKQYLIDAITATETKQDIETQRSGYLELGAICLNESKQAEFADFVATLEDHTDDEEYFTTLNYVIDALYERGNYFIICMDWKEEISTLTDGVSYTLRENFNQHIDLPQQEDYGKRASVSFDNVFKDFDKALNQIGLQLSFIDTNSDEYIAVVHQVEDLEKAKSAIRKIGYDHLDADSRKISG